MNTFCSEVYLLMLSLLYVLEKIRNVLLNLCLLVALCFGHRWILSISRMQSMSMLMPVFFISEIKIYNEKVISEYLYFLLLWYKRMVYVVI